MWVSDDVDELFTQGIDNSWDNASWWARHWQAALFIMLTVGMIIAVLVWFGSASASPAGGCGGG